MILFTADWHINLRHKNVPLEWALNRYNLFFEQLHNLERDVELHIIGGDVFDKVPTMEELDVYFRYIAEIKCHTLIYAGNHEATKKGQTFFSYLAEATNRVNPLAQVITSVQEHEKFYIVPYEFIHKKEVWNSLDKSKVVFSHIRGEIEPHVKPEIDLSLIADFPVVYLGDLHSHSNCQRNMVYPGSPMVTSFHRNRVSTGYLLIYGDDLCNWEWKEFKLPQLIRRTVSNPDEMIPTEYDHTIYELEGDVIDLSKVKDSELLDKKLVKRSSDTALILNKDMSMADELNEYLQFIMELPTDKIERVMSTFHDYAVKNT